LDQAVLARRESNPVTLELLTSIADRAGSLWRY
jgi:hypothetical protein